MNMLLKKTAGIAIVLLTLGLATHSAQAQAPAAPITNDTSLLPTGLVTATSIAPPMTGNSLAPFGLRIQMDEGNSRAETGMALKIFLLMTILSLAPSLVIMMTSFTRILIVLGFLRQALGTQGTPPNQILAGMAIFLTFFIMSPVFMAINKDALQPYLDGKITQEQAWDKGTAPLKEFMLKQTGDSELALFTELAHTPEGTKPESLGMQVVVPAFMISELKTAFQLGFLIYLPFLIIDLVVATALMSMGMMMLPPMMISLPVKILFFILADGWTMLIRSLVTSFGVS
jgi:flagellar biosynthetic protein FliP